MPVAFRLPRPLLFLFAAALAGLVAVPAGAAQTQQVARTVTFAAASTTASTSATVTFSGKLSKSPKGSKVKLQQKRGATWATVATVRTTTQRGAYVAVATMPSTAGVQQFRALAPVRKVTKNGKTRKLKKAASAIVTVQVQTPPVPPADPPQSAPEITTTHLEDGFAAQAYSQTLTTDDLGPGTWTQSGAPLGLSLDATTGELSGTSATPGDYDVVVRFTRSADGLFDEETFDLRLDTVTVPPVAAVTIDGGGRHACRIMTDASLWCWGHHGKGAVGIGPVDLADVRRPKPEQVGSDEWLQVSAAVENVQTFSCGIQADRSLWCWGADGASGQLGLGESGVQENRPALVDDTRNWATVSGGQSHTCATTLGGKLFCWGNLATGLAVGGANVPTEVDPGGGAWSSVSAGGGHTCGIRVTGTLWCWGYNSRGQLGSGGSPSESAVPLQVGTATDWAGLSAGAAHSCALRGTDLYCWGRNSVGAVGVGTPGSDVTAPAQVPGSWAQVAAAGSGNADHTCAIDTTGGLWCWGEGDQGRLGNGTTDDQSAPTQVGSDTTWASVTTGGSFSCAVRVNNTQWCWGGNTDGEIGVDSPVTEFLTPQVLSSCRGTASRSDHGAARC
jgi:alpha-tubulin suppressor-like RCC1 family protein